jgi:predicted TIM-barrel fold metal-dependent hydrolase
MTDNHIHIGQFNELYYAPLEVADIVMSSGMDGLSFSSCTSCVDNVSYSQIEAEIQSLLSGMSYTPEQVRPFFWFIPDYINQGVNIENASNVIPYRGIKIHPLAHQWDFENRSQMEALHNLFDYAACHALPVLVHSGHSGIDSADRFERFFIEYRNVQFIIAHCRPLDKTIEMIKLYDNVYCDTAFVPTDDLQAINNRRLGHKIIFGSDFPVTHYYRTKHPAPGKKVEITLREQYAEDIKNGAMLLTSPL